MNTDRILDEVEAMADVLSSGSVVEIAQADVVAWRIEGAWWVGPPTRRNLVAFLHEDGEAVNAGRLALEPERKFPGGAILVRIPDEVAVLVEEES